MKNLLFALSISILMYLTALTIVFISGKLVNNYQPVMFWPETMQAILFYGPLLLFVIAFFVAIDRLSNNNKQQNVN